MDEGKVLSPHLPHEEPEAEGHEEPAHGTNSEAAICAGIQAASSSTPTSNLRATEGRGEPSFGLAGGLGP